MRTTQRGTGMGEYAKKMLWLITCYFEYVATVNGHNPFKYIYHNIKGVKAAAGSRELAKKLEEGRKRESQAHFLAHVISQGLLCGTTVCGLITLSKKMLMLIDFFVKLLFPYI